jgi:hypothetical protein
VEARLNTSSVALRGVRGDEMEHSACLYLGHPVLGEIKTGTWPVRIGGLDSETVKYCYESRGTRARK